MKKITILLLIAITFASCQKKDTQAAAESTPVEMSIKEQPVATQAPPILSESKNAEEKSFDKKGEREAINGNTLTLNMASAGAATNEEKDKKNENESTNTATTRNHEVTKEPSQIIKNATVNFQVENTDSSHSRIAQMISASNAYFGSDKRIQNNYSIQQVMVIRVPAVNFDKVMDALMKESIYTDSKDITADDVTAEFVDIQARLKSKKEVEQRYTELLGRAQKVSDVLEVENNLRVIREEIESTEGRLKLLKDQVAYSTIYLTTTQKLKGEPQPEVNFSYRLKEAGINGWRGLEFFALTIVTIWPFLMIILPLVIWIGIRRRRRTAK